MSSATRSVPGMSTRAPASMARRALGAVAAGALLACSFPPWSLLAGWAAIPAFALLALSVRATPRLRVGRGALLGAAAGMAFHLVLLSWLRVLGVDAWLAVAVVCTAFWVFAGALLPCLLAQRWWVLGVPLLWVTMEAVLARSPFGGFPWGRLAFSQSGTPLRGWAVLGGSPSVTFMVALAGCLLAAAAVGARSRPNILRVLVGLAVGTAGGVPLLQPGWGGPVTRSAPIAIVQGNVPRVGLDFNAQRRAVLDNHVRVTQALAAEVAAGRWEQPVAVIWPENSSDIDPLRNSDAADQIDRAADVVGAPILVGAVLTNPADPSTLHNVSMVWDPQTGPGDTYVKRHPVPFGEYLPFRGVLTRFITRFERIPRDFAAGNQPGLLTIGGVPAGVVICFEIADDGLVREAVVAGGEVLVVQTNNATYGLTGQPDQQLAITRIQAVATGRTTLVAATSGISAVVGADGAIPWRTDQFTADATVADVSLRYGTTPAVRLGAAPEAVAVISLLLLLAASGLLRARPDPRRTGDSTSSGEPERVGEPHARGTLDQ